METEELDILISEFTLSDFQGNADGIQADPEPPKEEEENLEVVR